MRLSVERLRVGLIAGAVILVAVLMALAWYGRWVAKQKWNGILGKIEKKNGITFTHDTNGFTYSQSDGKRTIFTLHAKTATPEGNGKYSLHEADMLLYGKAPGEIDRVYGKDFEYDEKEGVARALGEVEMALELPASMAERTKAPGAAAGEEARTIHVRTSGLVYLRRLGVAATDQPAEFRWGGLVCSSKGAEFHPNDNFLRLLADVHLTGTVRNQPVDLTAASADLDRNANTATLVRPSVHSAGRAGRAEHGVAVFRNDGSLASAQATGAVALTAGTQQITAARLEEAFNAQSQPEHAKLSGGVTLADTNGEKPLRAAAQTADASFDARGAVSRVVADGGVAAMAKDCSAKAQCLGREMHGDHVVMDFAPGARKSESLLREIHATGNASAKTESFAAQTANAPAGLKTTEIRAADLLASFLPGAHGKPEAQKLVGTGQTVLHETAPLGEEQTSTGDALEIAFAPASSGAAAQKEFDASRIASAVQTGHVVIHSRAAQKPGAAAPTVSTAQADRAVYSGSTDLVTLTGNARFDDGENSLTALSAVIDQKTGDAQAHGNVAASLKGQGSRAQNENAAVTHVLASDARFVRATKVAEFRGTDAAPARLWQEASQVQAAILTFDGIHRTLVARPMGASTVIHAVFAGQSAVLAPGAKLRTGAEGNVVRVASQRMDYADAQRTATFAGMVRIENASGDIESQRAAVFLSPAKTKEAHATEKPAAPAAVTPFNGSVERVVVYGDVRLYQPGRTGTGDQLVYTAASGSYVLTGTPAKPPQVSDAQQGEVTGATLLFSGAGSTIVVAGDSAAHGRGGRVRTETEVRR